MLWSAATGAPRYRLPSATVLSPWPDRPPSSASASASLSKCFNVIDEFKYWRKKPDLAEAVAAIMALAAVIRYSEATTMMEIEIELKKASDTLKVPLVSNSAPTSHFLGTLHHCNACPRLHIWWLHDFGHGFSWVVSELLKLAASMACATDEVDMVFVGADGVVQSGCIINMIITYQTALAAHSMNKPVHVAAESYKFAHLYSALRPIDFGVSIPSELEVETSARDYTLTSIPQSALYTQLYL